MSEPKYRDEEWLREQYLEKRKSTTEIGDECGCHSVTVSRWLEKHGIEARPRNEPLDERIKDAEWLRERYVEQEWGITKISEKCGCGICTVSRWLKKHDIEARDPARVKDKRLKDGKWLQEQYVEKHRRTPEIADECGCQPSTVSSWLKKHDIEARPLVGENNPNWNGGPAVYGPGWNESKRQEVRERDDHTCQDPRCSTTQEEHVEVHDENLHVHHLRKARGIEDPEKRNAPENLITLCRDCHRRWEKIADSGLVPQVESLAD